MTTSVRAEADEAKRHAELSEAAECVGKRF